MIDWNFIAMCVTFVFLAGIVTAYFAYEMHLCSKIDKQLTRIEKLINEQGDSNDMDI